MSERILRIFSFAYIFLFVLCANLVHASELGAEDEAPMVQAPAEVVAHILSYLSYEDIIRAQQVCRCWREVLEGLHGPLPALSVYLLDTSPLQKVRDVSDCDIARVLSHHVSKSGYVPLAHGFVDPTVYPQGTRLLKAHDVAAHHEILSLWHNIIFGSAFVASCESQQGQLSCVMAALPDILIASAPGEKVFGALTSYVREVARYTPHARFTGQEGQQDKGRFEARPHTLVVRSQDLRAHKHALNELLSTRSDHRVVLVLDGEDFAPNGVLSLSLIEIPENLHQLVLRDPFEKIKQIDRYFLMFCKEIVSFDMQGLTCVTKVKDHFMEGCVRLTSFEPKQLTHVLSTGAYFLECTGLSQAARQEVIDFIARRKTIADTSGEPQQKKRKIDE